MIRNWKVLGCGLVVSLFLLLGGTANATLVNLNISGTFTAVPAALVGFVPIGTPLSIDISLDDAEPNLLAAPDYNAVNVGTLSSFLIIAVPGTVDAITLTDATSTWVADMQLDLTSVLAGVYLPVTATVIGTGYTPGQILPDFSFPLAFGELDVDGTALGAPGEAFLADITGITVTPIPEPGTALLVGLGLVVIAGRRRSLA